MTNFTPRKILHIDLSETIPLLTLEPDYQVFYVVFWWQNIPLCHQEILAKQLPMSPEQLIKLVLPAIALTLQAHFLEHNIPFPDTWNNPASLETWLTWQPSLIKLGKQLAQPSSGTVSVVICTRDRPEHLAQCLHSLQQLSPPPDEIVVVDNAPSSDQTRQIVAQMPEIRYILEPRLGLDFARNAGINDSYGEIIAFTDDDVRVHPNWIAQLRYGFRHSEVMAVTGLVLASELDTLSQFIFEKYWSFNRGYCCLYYDTAYFKKYQMIGVPAWRVGAGANMAFRRETFAVVGNFDERLDVGVAGCSGDSELWYRVLAQGGTCRYEPTAIAYHSHRREMTGLKKQIFYYMRGHVTELLIRFERSQHWGNLVRIALLVPYFSYLTLFGFLKGWERYSTLGVEIMGCFSGFKFYWQNKR